MVQPVLRFALRLPMPPQCGNHTAIGFGGRKGRGKKGSKTVTVLSLSKLMDHLHDLNINIEERQFGGNPNSLTFIEALTISSKLIGIGDQNGCLDARVRTDTIGSDDLAFGRLPGRCRVEFGAPASTPDGHDIHHDPTGIKLGRCDGCRLGFVGTTPGL